MKKHTALLLAACVLAVPLARCSARPPAAPLAPAQLVLEMEEEAVLTLPDGQEVDRWREYYQSDASQSGPLLPNSWSDYCLPDGAALLRERDLMPPALPDSLPAQAAQAIQAHYTRQGRLYDRDALLRAAYAAYQAGPEGFQPWDVSQESRVSGLAEGVVYCTTELSLPLGGQQETTSQAGAVFDRETGAPLSVWSLFTLPEEEAKALLLSHMAEEDPRRALLYDALTEDKVVWTQDRFSLYFPLGSLEGEEAPLVLSGPTLAEMADALHAWAVPQAEGEAAA